MNTKNKLFDSKSSIFFSVQTMFGTAFTYLTTGAFLSGLAILMGARDVLVSYLSVIANICGVLILAFAAVLERFHSKKRLTIGLTILSKLATFFIVLIPAFVPADLQLVLFIPSVIAAFTLQAQATVTLNQWMIDFIDEKKRGRYMSIRQTLALIITIVLSLTSGYVMDSMGGKYIGFVILFSAAFLMGIFEIIILLRTPDSTTQLSSSKLCRLSDSITIPFKNRAFLSFVIYIVVFYLLLNISDSFTMVYMMRYLKLPYKTVTIMCLFLSLPQIILLGVWGKISDRRGHHFVLKTSIWLFAAETLLISFSTQQSYVLFLPLAFIMASIGNAGFIVAVFNRRYELMPKQNRIVYDNFYTAAIGIGFILGPMIGGAIKNLLESSTFVEHLMPFANIRLLYIISTIGILLLQIIYSHLEKKAAAQCKKGGVCCG